MEQKNQRLHALWPNNKETKSLSYYGVVPSSIVIYHKYTVMYRIMCVSVEKYVVVSCGLNVPNDNVQNNNKEKYEGLK